MVNVIGTILLGWVIFGTMATIAMNQMQSSSENARGFGCVSVQVAFVLFVALACSGWLH